MTYLIEQLINGICQGAIYALFAIGYTIIVGVVGLVSFTFGEVIMIGAFAALFTATLTGGNSFDDSFQLCRIGSDRHCDPQNLL